MTVIHRDGSWTVELITPIQDGERVIDAVTIAVPEFDVILRWGQRQIASTMALLAELTGVEEPLLRRLKFNDADRVILALMNVIPAAMRRQFEEGERPMASEGTAAAPQPVARPVSEPQLVADLEGLAGDPHHDPVDPRFPKAEGPIHRFTEPPHPDFPPAIPGEEGRPAQPAEADEETGFSLRPVHAAVRAIS